GHLALAAVPALLDLDRCARGTLRSPPHHSNRHGAVCLRLDRVGGTLSLGQARDVARDGATRDSRYRGRALESAGASIDSRHRTGGALAECRATQRDLSLSGPVARPVDRQSHHADHGADSWPLLQRLLVFADDLVALARALWTEVPLAPDSDPR